jgi:hypothetical protein
VDSLRLSLGLSRIWVPHFWFSYRHFALVSVCCSGRVPQIFLSPVDCRLDSGLVLL